MPNALDAHKTSKHKFLLLGDTGSGKTTQFLTLPGKKFIYLFDPNAILSLRGYDVDYEEYLPDRLNLSVKSLSKDKGGDKTTNLKNDLYREWEEDFDSKMSAGFFDQYDVIGVDSCTTLLDLIMDRILTINGRAGHWPQQDDYGPQMNTFTNICRTFMSMDKTIFMTGHLETKQDQLTQRIFRQPMMTGRLTKKIPLLFSDIFITEVESDGKGNVTHKMQTTPDRMTTAVRSSFSGLDPFEDVTLDFTQPLEDQGLGGLIKWEQKENSHGKD
jgi:hypothetical protein